MNVKIICEYCEQEFIVPIKQRNKKYCNRQCYINSGIKGKQKNNDVYEKRTCVNCGKEFEIRKKLQNKLCSDECRKTWSLIPENKEKRIDLSKKTLLEKYGVESLFKTNDGQKYARESFKLKYGVEYPMHVKDFVNKLKTTIRNNYIPILLDKINSSNIKLIDEYVVNKNGNTSKSYRFQCITCNNIFTSTLLGSGKIPICRKCFPLVNNSTIEQEIKDILNEYGVDFINNDKKVLNGQEIDLLLKNSFIGFEVNGNYYHSEIHGEKDKKYHINKTILANKKGIKLFHIFEDEIVNHPNIVKSRIKNILGLTQYKIYARKCVIKEISKKESTIFLNNNHLQGNSVDKIRYGLYYNDNLISIMTFGYKRKSLGNKIKNENEYELLRFCNKIDHNVIGGFSKLLKYFIKNNTVDKIITFSDIRWSGIIPEDTVYHKNGFKYVHISSPNYWYVSVGDFLNRKHRFQYRKDKLVNEGYDNSKTEWEIMKEKGYDRIWDCGNMKFELILKK